MADTDGKGGFAGFLSRPDGGLLTLNLGTLTFVAGLEKFGDVQKALNFNILVGGLCVGLFFAILCAYFTLFGARAAVAEGKRIGSRARFDTDLTMIAETDDPWDGPIRFIRWLGFCLLPLVCVGVVLALPDDRGKADKPVAESTQKLHDECPNAAAARRARYELGLLTGDAAKARQADLEAAKKQVAHCEALIAATNGHRDKSKAAWTAWAMRLNAVIVAGMAFYLFAPFFVWSSAGRANPPPLLDETPREFAERRRRTLVRQIGSIQSMRLAAAVLSLAAFMVGVGLALVNTGVANIGSGLAEGTAPVATQPPPSTVQLNVSGQPVINNNFGQNEASMNRGGSAPDPVIPNEIILKLDLGDAGGWPKQSIQIEGLADLKLPAAPQPKVDVTVEPAPPTPVTVLAEQGLPGKDGKDGRDGDPGRAGAPGPVTRCKLAWSWDPLLKRCTTEPAPTSGGNP